MHQIGDNFPQRVRANHLKLQPPETVPDALVLANLALQILQFVFQRVLRKYA